MNEYLYWNYKLKIVRYPGNIVNVSMDTNKNNRHIMKKDIQEYRVNETAVEIMRLINGRNTYDDVVKALCDKYGREHSAIKKKLDDFIKMISKQYGLNIVTQNEPIEQNIVEMNKDVVSPMVASIEITNKCNIRCVHCYGDFGEIPCEVMDLEVVKKILSDLRSIGVRIIEITGGEATTHPKIEEIIEYALALGFEQVSLLTNGVKISDRLIQILERSKERVYVQIDLHSLREEYFSWFTKTPNVLEKVKHNIVMLAEKGILMRVATILTPKNIDELVDIADWVHNLGIARYAVSPVVSLGRANSKDKELYLDVNDAMKAEEQLQKIVAKYDNFLNIITSDFNKQINCGCITSHIVIDSKGCIKICTMDNLSYCNGSIGNIVEENIRSIFEKNVELLNILYTTKAPKFNSDECRSCENAGFCNGCLLRGIIKAKEMKDECLWYKNMFHRSSKRDLLLKKVYEGKHNMKIYSNLKILIPYIKRSKIYFLLGLMGILFASAIVSPVPYFIGKVLDTLLEEDVNFSDIKFTLILILLIYSAKFLINISYQYFFAKLQQNVINEIRMSMVERIIDAPLSFINKREKGYILSRIGEVQQIGAIFSPTIITSFVGIFEIFFCFVMMLSINIKLTLVALIIIPGYFTISKVISKKITKNTIKVQEDSANLNADMFETLNGIEEVKLLNGKQVQLKKILSKTQILIRSAIKQNLSMVAFIQSISFASDLVTVVILALAGIFIINGEITIGVYTAFSLYIGKILGVTQSVGTFEITIKPVCVTIERVKEFLFSDLETHKDSKSLGENIYEVFFEDVSFGYKAENIFINKITQSFVEGDKVLILGENGSGKTTFVKLLVGLYEPFEGNIFINGKSIDQLSKEDIRKKVGIVSQDIFLFKGSVIENILFGVNGKDRKDVLTLLEKFELIDYIERLPNGLDTKISQNGVGISGGQAQIIAFIRAIIKDKDILILDEATSNLDQDTCKKIMSILCHYKLCRILFVISHQKLDYEIFNKIIQL